MLVIYGNPKRLAYLTSSCQVGGVITLGLAVCMVSHHFKIKCCSSALVLINQILHTVSLVMCHFPCGIIAVSCYQLSRDGNFHGSGILHTMTASPKPSFRAPWRGGDAVVGSGNAGWTTSKGGHPCPCQNCSQGASCRKDWKRISAESSLMYPQQLYRSRG